MADMNFKVSTLNERSDLTDQVARLDDRSWPIFLQNGDVKSWSRFYNALSKYVLVVTQADELIGAGFTVPVRWDGKTDHLPENIEAVLNQGMHIESGKTKANTLVPIGALVDAKAQGRGLSSVILKEMKKLAERLELTSLIVPVRPTKKSSYPLQSMHSYSTWRRPDGLLYDPWLRVHEKLGAKVVKIADCTLVVEGSIKEWSDWTGMVFPESGGYVVPGALDLVDISLEKNMGIYKDPNVWMLHPM